MARDFLFSSAQKLPQLAIINNHIGYIYNFPIRVGGFILMFLGLAITLTGIWGIFAGILLFFAGGYFGLTATGISIDTDIKSVRHYTSYFGIKYGRWNEYPTYPHICIIRKERKRNRFLAEASEEADKPYQYEVNLLSRSHRGKVLLQIMYEREIAERVANRFAGEMNCDVVEYEPPGRAKKRRSHSGEHHGHPHRHSSDE